MNTRKRYLYGLISTLLFAAGFARAAERFDPVTHSRPAFDRIVQAMPPGPCELGITLPPAPCESGGH